MNDLTSFAALLFSCILAYQVLRRTYKAQVAQSACKHCGAHTEQHRGSYIRGYNYMCRQAHGSQGSYCGHCNKVSFDTSDEQYVVALPDWCDHRLKPASAHWKNEE